MGGDDPIGDRQPQTGAAPRRFFGVERLEDLLEGFRLHPVAVVLHGEGNGIPSVLGNGDTNRIVVLGRVEAVGDQIDDDLLDLLRVHPGDDRAVGDDLDVPVPVARLGLEHFDHTADHLGQVGGGFLAASHPREVEQFRGDALAAERLLFDQLDIFFDDRQLVSARLRIQTRIGDGPQAARERFGRHRDRGQGIIDLVGDPRGQEPDARQPLGPDNLLGALMHLLIEVVADAAEPLGHLVERLGKLQKLILRVDPNPIVKVPRGDPPRTGQKNPQRLKDPDINQPQEDNNQDDRGDEHGDRDLPNDSVADPHGVRKAGQLLMQTGRELFGDLLNLA